MPTDKQLVVSRRTLLGSAAVLSGYALLVGNAPAAVAQTSSLESSWFRAEGFDLARATSFSKDWTRRLLTPFPVRIPMTRPAHAGSLQIEWDTRLFDAPTRAFSLVDGVTVNAAVVSVAKGSVSVSIPKGATDIVVPVGIRNPYPEENLASETPTVLRYVNPGGKTLEELKLQGEAVACTAWGVEAQVSWVTRGGSVVPDVVTLTSVGPGAIPTGVVANLTFPDVIAPDPSVIGFDDSAKVPFTVHSSSQQGTRQIAIETVGPVPAGARTDFVFGVEGSDSLPGEWPEVVPRLVIGAPLDAGARLTEKLTVFPVTSGGTQLSTYLGATRALELATREVETR